MVFVSHPQYFHSGCEIFGGVEGLGGRGRYCSPIGACEGACEGSISVGQAASVLHGVFPNMGLNPEVLHVLWPSFKDSWSTNGFSIDYPDTHPEISRNSRALFILDPLMSVA